MPSSNNTKKELPPPSYDQVTTIDIYDSGTAPLLSETFSGSIFGKSTIVTFELASGSYPKYKQYNELVEKPKDYNFVIRDYLGCVQGEAKVANLRLDLSTTLLDVLGTEILHYHKQDLDSIEPTTNPPSAMSRFMYIIFDNKKENTVHTFEVSKNGTRIGLVTFGDNDKPETWRGNLSSLKIYVGNGVTGFIVKSLTMGEFSIFRDQASGVPLCNINIDTNNGKIIFHPETGITTEEQLLCTASALAYQTLYNKLDISESNQISFRLGFWMVFTIVVTTFVCWISYVIFMAVI